MRRLKTLLALCAGHALCDYPLQGDFLAKGKNHKQPIPGVPFGHCLSAHALIQAGMVLAITDSVPLAVAELAIHAATDYAKCDGKLTFNQDQAIHYGCKVLWAFLAAAPAGSKSDVARLRSLSSRESENPAEKRYWDGAPCNFPECECSPAERCGQAAVSEHPSNPSTEERQS